MIEFDYYQAPSQEVFEDIKKNAIEIWKTYDDDFAVWFDNDKIDVVVDRGIKKDLYTLVPVKL